VGRFRDKGSKWKGGAYISQDGYLQRLVSSNPKKYYPSHRLLMENHLGRPLTNDEVVHHINGNKLDNRIENLAAMTNGEHVAIHNKTRLKALPEGGK
jgi:hypothetical protein